MNTTNENQNPSEITGSTTQEAPTCGASCTCHAGGGTNRVRGIIGVIIILAASALVVRAVLKSNNASSANAGSRFAALPTAGRTNVPATLAVIEIGSLSELNTLAADRGGVFVFLPAINDPPIKAPLAPMRSAAKTIETQGTPIGLFKLKTDSPDYAQVAEQVAAPVVLAMVKGGGMVPVSGDITEAKLIQGFVAASSAGGCGPSGCGPSGCN